MEREKEIYTDKSETQAIAHGKARERQAAAQQSPQEIAARPESTPEQSQAEAQDAVLSWSSGNYTTHAGRGDRVFSETDAIVAGVGSVNSTEAFRASEPGLEDSAAGGRLTSSPDCGGGASGVNEILSGGRGR